MHNTYPTAEAQLAPAELVEAYINTQPPTRGIFEGPLADAEDGLYFSPNVVDESLETLPQVVKVDILPGAQLGAADSHHGVVFGRVAINIEGRVGVVEAAIKEFTTESEKAGQEHDALLAAKRRGLETFEPLAVAKDGPHTYLVTRRRAEVSSMDNEDWTISPSNTKEYEAAVVPNLHYIADKLALMHSKGIVHGDAQPKNVMRTETGQFVAGDLEDAEVAYTDEELVQMIGGGWEPRDSKALGDVWHCWYAMTHPLNGENPDETVKAAVFLENETYETCMTEFENNFLNPYMDYLKQHMDPNHYAQIDAEALRDNLYKRVAMTT